MSEMTPVLPHTYHDAAKDAAAIVAALRKGDTESALLLAGFYTGDLPASEALCMAFAALANACLNTIDNVRDYFNVTDGVVLPSGDDVLKTVIMKLAEQ
jgi:hypothetical protein